MSSLMDSFKKQLDKENTSDTEVTSKDNQKQIKDDMLKSLAVLVENFKDDVIHQKIKADNIKDAKDLAAIYASILGLGAEDSETPELSKGARNVLTQNNTIINNNGGKELDLDDNQQVSEVFEKLDANAIQKLIDEQQVEQNKENGEEL